MVVVWKIDQPRARGVIQDIWLLTEEEGALEARRKGGALSGPTQLERFGPAIDSAERLWPSIFKHNPWTGERLRPALEPLSPAAGRFGGPNGLPILEGQSTGLDISSRQTVKLERGSFYFGQGGSPGFLYAADLDAGQVYRRSRLAAGWINHGRYERSELPPWASGMAANLDGVFYSGATELVRLNEDPEDDGSETCSLGPMLAAPAALKTGVAAPYRNGEAIGIGWWAQGGGIRRLPVRGQPPANEELLSAPVINVSGVAFWIGEGGFLSFELGPSGAEAVWRAWTSDFRAKPFLRPYRNANGHLWAFGTVADGGSSKAAVCHMSAANGSRQVHVLEGPHVSAGGHTYRGLGRHARPWDDPIERMQPGLHLKDRWALPIVSLPSDETVVALVEDSTTMRSFIFREGRQSPRLGTLFLHRPNAGLVPMGHSFDLTTTDDLDVFVAENQLNIYHRDTNECVGWPLV